MVGSRVAPCVSEAYYKEIKHKISKEFNIPIDNIKLYFKKKNLGKNGGYLAWICEDNKKQNEVVLG